MRAFKFCERVFDGFEFIFTRGDQLLGTFEGRKVEQCLRAHALTPQTRTYGLHVQSLRTRKGYGAVIVTMLISR